jgi:hypothetical protein
MDVAGEYLLYYEQMTRVYFSRWVDKEYSALRLLLDLNMELVCETEWLKKLLALQKNFISKRRYKMQKVNWLVVGIIGVVALLLLFGGGMMMGGWGYRGWSMMGPSGMVGPGGMTLAPGASAGVNNWGYSSTPSPIGWIGMIFMWLIPVGLVVLAAFGAVWLVKNVGNSKPPSS